MDTNSPEAWFKNLPLITRNLLVASFSTTCLVVVGLLDSRWIMLDWSLVTQKYGIDLYRAIFLLGIIFGVFYPRRCSSEASRSAS